MNYQTAAHTPTPWRVAPDEPLIVETMEGKEIADYSMHNATMPSVKNAAFTCQAVNAHQELVAALNSCLILLSDSVNSEEDRETMDVIRSAEKAIAKAEGAL